LDAVSDIVELVNQLGGLERAKRAQKVLEKLIDPFDFGSEPEVPLALAQEQGEVPTTAAS
jgi:hypothetical protein